jgi:hypothetical protein
MAASNGCGGKGPTAQTVTLTVDDSLLEAIAVMSSVVGSPTVSPTQKGYSVTEAVARYIITHREALGSVVAAPLRVTRRTFYVLHSKTFGWKVVCIPWDKTPEQFQAMLDAETIGDAQRGLAGKEWERFRWLIIAEISVGLATV